MHKAAEHVKQVHLECQQFVLQVKEAECREAEVERDAMAKKEKVGDLEMANQGQRGTSGRERRGRGRGRGKQRRGRGSLAYNSIPNSQAHIILTRSYIWE